MGGINHQPCNQVTTNYLRCSTGMSRSVSMAHVRLESANVALEDLILAELDGRLGRAHFNEFGEHLVFSRLSLEDALVRIQELREELKRCGYSDLPTLHAINLDALGSRMSAEGLVEADSWKEVTHLMKSGTFYSILDHFERHVTGLIQLTDDLHEKSMANWNAVENKELNLVLEQNRMSNFRIEFSQLYTAWGKFHRTFLASSMLSTELWYAYTHKGSLFAPGQSVQVA